jgi:hypothetical protein
VVNVWESLSLRIGYAKRMLVAVTALDRFQLQRRLLATRPTTLFRCTVSCTAPLHGMLLAGAHTYYLHLHTHDILIHAITYSYCNVLFILYRTLNTPAYDFFSVPF